MKIKIMDKKIGKNLNSAQKFLIKTVKIYQKTISPDHSFLAKKLDKPPFCKFYPTCSDYMIKSIEKKWAIIGLLKGTWRICRCNPWSKWWLDDIK